MKFLSERNAIRIGISASGSLTDDEVTSEYPNHDPTRQEKIDSDRWSHSVTLLGQFLKHRGAGPIWMYYGGGPKFSYSNSSYENHRKVRDGDESDWLYSLDKNLSLSSGLSGVLGVQKCFGNIIALHAEYGFSLMYQWTKDTDKDRREKASDMNADRTRKIHSFTASSTNVRFGLSVFF